MKNLAADRLLTKQSALTVFCAICVTVVFGMILSIDSLSPINDHQFIVSLFQGKHFGAYVDHAQGRFTPLSSQEYALAARWFGASSFLFHLIHAVQAALCGVALFLCLRLSTKNTFVCAILWISVFFSIGFLYSSAILQAGELNALFLLLIFSGTLLLREKFPDERKRQFDVATAIGLAALAISFLYKETIFLMALVLGACEFIRSLRARRKRIPTRVYAMLALGIIYIVGYIVWHGAQMKGTYAETHSVARWDLLRLYAANDPLIIFIALPLAAIRTALILRNFEKHTLFDSFLLTATAYVGAFLLLGMYASYYLLPAYGFAVCGIAGVIAGGLKKTYSILLSVLCLILTVNNSTIAFADFDTARKIANNHDRFISTISTWLWANPTVDGTPRHIVLEGVSPGGLVEIVFSIKRYLESRGLTSSDFTIETTELSDNKLLSDQYGFKAGSAYQPQVGDLLVYNPFQSVAKLPPLLSPSLQPIFRSDSEWTIPRWPLRTWLHRCLNTSDRCLSLLATSSPYTGYAAMLMTRVPKAVEKIALVTDTSYRVGPLSLPDRMRKGSSQEVRTLVQNTGAQDWPVAPTAGSSQIVDIGYLWLDASGKTVASGAASHLPETIQPKDIAEVSMIVTAPTTRGQYTLVVSPLQQNVEWFYSTSAPRSGGVKSIEVF
jgi:hypothetical protein